MRLLTLLALGYGGYAALVWSLQRSLLFPGAGMAAPPGVAATVPGLESAFLEVGGAQVETWWLPPREGAPRPAPAVVFAHGNGELIDHWPHVLAPYRELGCGLLLVEYPGYGRSTGSPSEESVAATMLAAYDALVRRPEVDPQRIVLHGRSLGAGAVALLAERRAAAALVLQSSFTSVRAFAAGFLVPGLLVRDPFDVVAALRRYDGPVLLLHGERDRIVPPEHARHLLAAARRGRLVTYPVGHNDLPDPATYWRDLQTFLAEAGILGTTSR